MTERGPQLWTDAGAVPVVAKESETPERETMDHLGVPVSAPRSHPREHAFSPYSFNGGTALAVAGEDFVVVAADTRLTEGLSILSRDVSKIARLTDRCVVATGGSWNDVATLHKTLHVRVDQYRHNHEREIATPSVAQQLSNTLYYRRFFPFYAFNVLAGLDRDGRGAVYTYDAVGSFERVGFSCQGAGQKLIIPLLDNLIGWKTRTDPKHEITVESAVSMAKEAFVSACERDVHTGDCVEILVITADGVSEERFDLKRD